jgi:crotonobetainyl-CoA:carnitine CoA-transferase CaiB-like acyl-CoA transferase
LTGAGHLKADARFASIAERHKNLEALTPLLDELLSQKASAEWTALFAGRVPFAPVLDVKEALDNPYLEEISMIDTVAHEARAEGVRTVASPFRVNGERPQTARAPKLGEQDNEILGGKP